ncbi:MAG: M20/M25/M40 family metallo-hydrolase [Candidatus Latescibacterota bacterium]|jgi:acetylornithine deacetylase
MKLDVVRLTQDLIAFPSVSQVSNAPVTRHLAALLGRLGFEAEEVAYADRAGIEKLCLVARLGKGRGGLTLFSHDDVVPARLEDGWTADPFEGRVSRGRIYGRGACDMKGPLAATICAASRFRSGDLAAPLFLVITADEELQARGARQLVTRSRLFDEAAPGYGVICEPTCLQVVHAHKGALAITVTSRGRAAHTSTLKGISANVKMIPFLAEMKRIYDLVLASPRYRNDLFSPPCSEWSIGINDHNVATNMTPVRSVCTISYRPMPGIDANGLVRRTEACAARHGLECEVFQVGDPLYTPADAPLVRTALRLAGKRRPRTVPYGTDGMIFVQKMKELVVLGPGDIAQAHTVDEWISVEALRRGVDLYSRFIEHVCVCGLP